MGFMFLVFIYMGFSSFKAGKELMARAEKEDELINRAKEYMGQEITADRIDARLSEGLSDEDTEQLYFARIEIMRKSFKAAFPEMDEALAEKLMDDRYTEIYEEA